MVKLLFVETTAVVKKASTGAVKKCKSSAVWQAYEICRENYGNALSGLGKHDKSGFNSNLLVVLTNYVTCYNIFDEIGIPSPLSMTNAHLGNIAGNGLYLATFWH